MKKVAIVTLIGYFNYGNRLQNYALQETIKHFGFNVETIRIVHSKNKVNVEKVKSANRIKKISNTPLIELFNKIFNKLWFYINKKEILKSNNIRNEVFKKFTMDYIQETNYEISNNKIMENIPENYNYFVTGSDQVWNPSFNFGSSIYFLTFAEKHKRISYAPSFGVSVIKSEYIEDYKEWLSGMHRLSVREDDGARIIKELTGREAPVLVDPTLLLTREKWLSISKEASNKPKTKYLLTYFLGGVPNEFKKQIKNIAKENKLEIINLGDIKEKDTYRTGPNEFVDYINSCSIMCTDSFHGTVFSILFEKPFIVYERIGSSQSMYSRIETLLDMFRLRSREIKNIKSDGDVFNIDYSHVPYILETERKRSFAYLKEALNIKEEN